MRILSPRLLVTALAAAASLALAACNSTSDDGSNSTTQSATGIWSGSDSVTGMSVTALINSGGQATFIRSDGVQFDGSVQVSGSTLAATVDGYPDYSSTFSDGTTYGIGTLSGTVSTGDTLTATLTFTTNGNTSITGNWSLSYESLSDTASSVTAISGDYTDAATGASITLSTTGSISGTNASNGCTVSGSVATADTTHNIYEVAYSYANCTGGYASLNGVQLTGLATINPTLSPVQVLAAAAGSTSTSSGTSYFGIVSSLTGAN